MEELDSSLGEKWSKFRARGFPTHWSYVPLLWLVSSTNLAETAKVSRDLEHLDRAIKNVNLR